jgi:hypothetical protein
MTEPIFPMKPPSDRLSGSFFVIRPYRHEGAWVFDDARVGLKREPFVSGITEMIDRLVADIPNADQGFRLLFASAPFDGYQGVLTWARSDPVEGSWYRDEQGQEGWLCPALFLYFASAPEKIYLRAVGMPYAINRCPCCNAPISPGEPVDHYEGDPPGFVYSARCEGCGATLVGTGRPRGEAPEEIYWIKAE